MFERKRGSSGGWIRGRGRGRGRGGGNPAWRSRATASVSEPPAPAVGSLLATITNGDLEHAFHKEAPKITNCKLVGSYNWLNQKSPTILVPGSPPAWTPTPQAIKPPPDSGLYYRDQNAARYATHVFQPALEAILKQDAEFDFGEIDLVTCGSTLGNLRRFVAHAEKEFRLVVEAVGSAVFLVRRENSPTSIIPDVYGYGHTFPEANTTWGSDVRGSESHQRIIQYGFAGLSCLVRYEGDGYLPNLHHQSVSHGQAAADAPNDLLASLEKTMVSAVASDEKAGLTIQTAGEMVPQSAIFDLKTRTWKKQYQDVLKDELPRLWISQVTNFVIGFHNQGVFNDVRVEDVRNDVRQWEEEQEPTLQKLAALLKMLVAFAHSQKDGRFEVMYKGDALELREVGGEFNCCIPDSMKRRWMEGGLAGGQGSDKGDNYEWTAEDEEREADFWSGASDSDSEKDFTACSASSCGYCGHCGY
ncbi:hypothetical protein BJX76DRAFT_345963 [Aspergillus varians]